MKSIYKIIFSSLILMGLMTSCFDKFLEEDGKLYYFNGDGRLIKNTEIIIEGKRCGSCRKCHIQPARIL